MSDHCECCGVQLAKGATGWCFRCDMTERRLVWEQDSCICVRMSISGMLSGMSVCGVPCPVHSEDE